MTGDINRQKKLFGNEGTMGLFVALYLILLAFFILLNAVSEQAATRAAAAMESVNDTFKQTSVLTKQPVATADAENQASNDLVLSSVGRAFLAEMELQGRYGASGGNTFEVEFPVDYIFEPGSFSVRRDMTPFLDQLVAAVRQAPSNKRQQVVFLFGTGTSLVSREMTRTQEIAVRRAGSLARYMTGAGVKDGEFSVGFTAVSDSEIKAVFWSEPTSRIQGGQN
jgi:outer membrane protein OmpA-like peptidoglycan-associated protein